MWQTNCFKMFSDQTSYKLAWGQLTTILDAMADTSDVKSVQSGGFKVGDDKFICLRSDDTRLYGKMVNKDMHGLRNPWLISRSGQRRGYTLLQVPLFKASHRLPLSRTNPRRERR